VRFSAAPERIVNKSGNDLPIEALDSEGELILNPAPAFHSRSAANPVVLPNAKPRAMREYFVVPSVRSGEVARAQGSVVPHREDALKAFDFSNSLLGVHSVQISNMCIAMVKRRPHAPPAKANYEAYHLDMRRLHPECSDSESSDRSLPAHIFLREEPEDEEEEDEEEHYNDEDDDEDDGDEGYSE
jgi:hypothetical protein